jgi:hypothetical protein
MSNTEVHATLRDAILYFAEFEHCKEFMTDLRWPDGVVKCPTCDATKVTWLAKARVWKCYAKHPLSRFSLKTGTIFEDSPISLEKWLPAVWMLLNCKNGISSYELARDLGVTQKTGWFMLQRIRLAMQDDLTGGMLAGEVEVDETWIGGKARNMHKSKLKKLRGDKTGGGSLAKTGVQGMLERGGKVHAKVIEDATTGTLQRNVKRHVAKGSHVFTDEARGYFGLQEHYVHDFVNHAETYVNGNIHTNGLENFWALLKRGLKGTYISVEPFHLFRYVDEQAFRYNNRKMDDVDRFTIGMRQILGRRLTYAQLIGKEQVVQHG